MTEAITEMIIPGTYIDVRAEGLIGVSGIATGNVGLVGTASKGPVNEAVVLSSFSEARETFGEADAWDSVTGSGLSLVRAAQQVFANGGSTLYAVRTASASAAKGKRTLVRTPNVPVITLEAVSPGSWSDGVTVEVAGASQRAFIENRKIDAQNPVLNIFDSLRNVVTVTKGSGQTTRLRMVLTGPAAKGKTVLVNPDGTLTFDPADVPKAGDEVTASYEVLEASSRDVVVRYGNVKETYTGADATDLARDINAGSGLVKATVEAGQAGSLPDIPDPAVSPAQVALEGGNDGRDADNSNYATSLAELDPEPVHIVALAGRKFLDAQAALLAHVETGENNSRDRIAVVGADDDAVASVAANGASVGDDRLILVAPGIIVSDLATGAAVGLPAAYSAAAVAGVIASLPVHVSPTNKTLKVSGLTTYYNDGQIKLLLGNRVMPLERKAGHRIVKGITTDDGPFRQVSVRRIVDYAKAGTRIGSLPYIGRLNNSRVRAALQATLNGFLSDMVLNEALTEFTLTVTATREQEIAGVALVTMLLKPTFSIDFVKVIMNLA
jgi:hypothetical protein